jgi:hypothetical protein
MEKWNYQLLSTHVFITIIFNNTLFNRKYVYSLSCPILWQRYRSKEAQRSDNMKMFLKWNNACIDSQNKTETVLPRHYGLQCIRVLYFDSLVNRSWIIGCDTIICQYWNKSKVERSITTCCHQFLVSVLLVWWWQSPIYRLNHLTLNILQKIDWIGKIHTHW